MIKKALSFLLILCMMLGVIPASYAAPTDSIFLEMLQNGDEEVASEAGAVEKLFMELGIISDTVETYTSDEKIKYADFQTAMVALFEINGSYSDNEIYKALYDGGYVKNETKPSRITYDDMIYALVQYMGYKIVAEEKSYLSAAMSAGILDSVSYLEGAIPTKYDFVRMIYNSLINEPMGYTINGDGTVNYYNVDTNLLESRFDITLIEGIVTAYALTAINQSASLSDGYVAIEGIKYQTDIDFCDYVGSAVNAFLCDNGDYLKILSFEPDTRTTIVDIEMTSSPKLTSTSVEYKTESSKTKEYKLNTDAVIIYNGVYYNGLSGIDVASLNTSNASYRLIDNDNDGRYDTVHIWKYQYYAVSAVTETQIAFKYGMKLDGLQKLVLDSNDVKYRFFNGKAVADVSAVTKDGAVAIAKSLNEYGDKMITIRASSGKLAGTIDAVKTSDNKVSLTINGEVYNYVSENYIAAVETRKNVELAAFEIGSSVSFELAFDGTIVGGTASVASGQKTGYLVKGYYDEYGDTDGAILKIFTDLGKMEEFECKKKITYYDGKTTSSVRIKSGDAITAWIAEHPVDYRTICTYTVDDDGKISELMMPYQTFTEIDELNSSTGAVLTKDDGTPYKTNQPNNPDGYGLEDYYLTYDYYHERWTSYSAGYATNPSQTLYIGRDLPLFVVADTEHMDDEKYYTVETAYTYIQKQSDDNMYNLELYGIDEFTLPKYGVIVSSSASSEPVKESLAGYIVEEVSQVYYEEGYVGIKITYWKGAVKAVLEVSEECTHTNPKGGIGGSGDTLKYNASPDEGYPLEDLRAGDVIQFETDSLGYANNVKFLARLTEPDKQTGKYLWRAVNSSGSYTGWYGNVSYLEILGVNTAESILKYKYDEQTIVKYKPGYPDDPENTIEVVTDPSGGTGVVRCGSFKNYNRNARYYTYSLEASIVEEISIEDLIPGDKFMYIPSLSFAYEVYVIRD